MDKTKLTLFCSQTAGALDVLLAEGNPMAAEVTEWKAIREDISRLALAGGNGTRTDGTNAIEEILPKFSVITERLTGIVASVKGQLATASMALKGFEDRIKGGELLDKTAVQALCSATASTATETATKETEKRLREEFTAKESRAKLVGDRKAVLATASLPLPEGEDVLALPEAEFTAARTEAEKRLKPFAKKDKLGRLAWCSASEYSTLSAILGDVQQASGRSDQTFEPFAAGNASGGESTPGGCY